jgi:zinc D-Ala-D-Ala dipeptidase
LSSLIQNSLKTVLSNSDFIELNSDFGVTVDLKYATSDNFVGRDLYGPFNRAFLHKEAAEQLREARAKLQKLKPGHSFIIYDALRPRSIQRILWSHVEGTPSEMYVAHPDRGSMHCFGMAVDLSILDTNLKPLDMGAGFDDFREIAQPVMEDKYRGLGLLTEEHIDNRQLLRRCMEESGFRGLKHEWWHFDAKDRTLVRANYRLVE